MKNNLFWGAVALAALIVVMVFISSMKSSVNLVENNATSTPQDTTKNTPVSNTKANTGTAPIAGMQTSLGGVFSMKGNYQCDYESVNTTARSSNVVYLSDGKMRGEFRTTLSAGGTKANTVVYDGNYLYIWAEGQTTGKITQPKTLADLAGIIPEDVTSGKILGTSATNVSWNCHAWLKDPSKLVKPSYVIFN